MKALRNRLFILWLMALAPVLLPIAMAWEARGDIAATFAEFYKTAVRAFVKGGRITELEQRP